MITQLQLLNIDHECHEWVGERLHYYYADDVEFTLVLNRYDDRENSRCPYAYRHLIGKGWILSFRGGEPDDYWGDIRVRGDRDKMEEAVMYAMLKYG